MKPTVLATAALSFLVAAASTAEAQPRCAQRAALVDALEQKYQESAGGLGLAGNSMVYEIWASEKTGTWSIVATNPQKVSCVMAAGEGWVWSNHEVKVTVPEGQDH